MKIVTWNINSVKTLPQYQPWSTFKTHTQILDHIGADIICFQEMKISRAALPKSVALPGDYESFFSFTGGKAGYSGVAVYNKPPYSATNAVEGLSPSLLHARRTDVDVDTETPIDMLDGEGRTLVVDYNLFVLVNVYCPASPEKPETPAGQERVRYKRDFNAVLREKLRVLIEEQKREVILVGDLNAVAGPIDTVVGELGIDWQSCDWLRSIMEGYGMVDVVRKHHPDKRDMYTCWNTKKNHRPSNYGARIDYILVTAGLAKWVKNAEVQQDIHGSDHCPVMVEFHDTLEDGQDLASLMKPPEETPPAAFAARFWPEYTSQRGIRDFFAKPRAAAKSNGAITSTSTSSLVLDVSEVTLTSSQSSLQSTSSNDAGASSVSVTPIVVDEEPEPSSSQSQPSSIISRSTETLVESVSSTPDTQTEATPSEASSQPKKRGFRPESKPSNKEPPAKKQKQKKTAPPAEGQSKISTFFR